MRIEHHLRRDLSDAQEAAVVALNRAVYPPETRPVAPPVQWAGSPWSIMIWEGDQLVAYVGAITREGTLDGEPMLISGVGSVKTHPDARRNGYAGAGLVHAAAFLNDELAVDFSVLVCRNELLPYYGKFGWRHFQGEMLVEQPSGTETFTFNEVMVLDGRRVAPEGGVIDLCGMPW